MAAFVALRHAAQAVRRPADVQFFLAEHAAATGDGGATGGMVLGGQTTSAPQLRAVGV